ncbi:hypothetical protein Q6247_26080, partial [Klebsiella pneumoniae]
MTLSSFLDQIVRQEGRAAVKQMNKYSAPGPDGFGPSFYEATWSFSEEKVMDFLTAFENGTVDLERLNRA